MKSTGDLSVLSHYIVIANLIFKIPISARDTLFERDLQVRFVKEFKFYLTIMRDGNLGDKQFRCNTVERQRSFFAQYPLCFLKYLFCEYIPYGQ